MMVSPGWLIKAIHLFPHHLIQFDYIPVHFTRNLDISRANSHFIIMNGAMSHNWITMTWIKQRLKGLDKLSI